METSETTKNKTIKKKRSKERKKLAQNLIDLGFPELLMKEFVDAFGEVDEPIENIPVVEDDGDELWEDVIDNNNVMVIVINIGLNMSAGTTAINVANAALGLHELIKNRADLSTDLIRWKNQRCPKIVVEANNTNHFLKVWLEGKIRKIPFFCVYDTKLYMQIISLTALAFFGTDQELQPVTGQLRKLH